LRRVRTDWDESPILFQEPVAVRSILKWLPPSFAGGKPFPKKRKNKKMYSQENLARLKKMAELAPELMKTFWAFDKAAVAAGAIPVKFKELIAVAVALTTQCPYCIEVHSGNARRAGATEAEMVEAAIVAASFAGRSRHHSRDARLTHLK
jgi:AhpD family alkylhydroperoxidase